MINSCGTTVKISGEPGTEIYKPDMTKIATIKNTGETKIKFKLSSSTGLYTFLLSHNPGSDAYIPFAMDYKHRNTWGAFSLFLPSIPLIVVPAVLSKNIAVQTSLPLLGASLFAYSISRPYSVSYGEIENSIKYLSKQRTNEDLHFAEYVDKGYKKVLSSNKSTDTAQKTSTTETGDIPEKQDKAVSSSYTKSAFTLKNNAEKIIGQYNGQGVLMQSGIEVENFNKVTVFIENTNRKNVVSVKIIVGDGIDFFNSDCYYQVKKTASGFSLIMQDMPEATIEIDKENGLHYKHPKVNIDGEIMMLDIKASFNK